MKIVSEKGAIFYLCLLFALAAGLEEDYSESLLRVHRPSVAAELQIEFLSAHFDMNGTAYICATLSESAKWSAAILASFDPLGKLLEVVKLTNDLKELTLVGCHYDDHIDKLLLGISTADTLSILDANSLETVNTNQKKNDSHYLEVLISLKGRAPELLIIPDQRNDDLLIGIYFGQTFSHQTPALNILSLSEDR